MRYSLKGRVYDDLAYVSTNVRWDLNVRFLEELYLRSDISVGDLIEFFLYEYFEIVLMIRWSRVCVRNKMRKDLTF